MISSCFKASTLIMLSFFVFSCTKKPVTRIWKTYTQAVNDLPSDTIYTIVKDNTGNIWIGTDNGLSEFDGNTWNSYQTVNGLNFGYVKAIAFIGDEVLLATKIGIVVKNSFNWNFYSTKNSAMVTDSVNCIAITEMAILFGTEGHGLMQLSGSDWSDNSTMGDTIYSMASDKNLTWVAGNTGVFELGISAQPYSKHNYPSRCIAVDPQSNLWVSTMQDGLMEFDGQHWTPFVNGNGYYNNNNFSCIAIDSQGVIWLGTFINGVFRFDGSKWTAYTSENSGLINNHITSITIDNRNNVWIGTRGYGISEFMEK